MMGYLGEKGLGYIPSLHLSPGNCFLIQSSIHISFITNCQVPLRLLKSKLRSPMSVHKLRPQKHQIPSFLLLK